MEKYIVKDDGLFVFSSNENIIGFNKGEELYFYSSDKEVAEKIFNVKIRYGSVLLLKDKKGDISLFAHNKKDNLNEFFDIINEWKPKQGEKVLVKDSSDIWEERVFVIEHEGRFFCERVYNRHTLRSWSNIKPYEEQIEIGDWVKNENIITRFKSYMIDSDCTKITDPQLIELLNKEL